jgi:ribosomal protein S18 acetylase RimI-like enzyme
MTDFSIVRLATTALPPETRAALIDLCDAAYQEPIAPYLEAIGPGEHLLGMRAGVLVSHLMWVTRWLQPHGLAPLRTAYVEVVATAPHAQRRGYVTRLLEAFAQHVQDFDLAALCPATEAIYARRGWRHWRGPLAVRHEGRLVPTDDEHIMVLALPRTPALDDTQPLSIEWRPGEVW